MTDTSPSCTVGNDTVTGREIRQQPDVWREVGRSVRGLRPQIDAFLAPLLALPELRIVLTGAGTSAFVGEVAAPALARQLRRRVDAVATTDLVSDPHGRLAEDVPTLLVSFARSGDSPESVTATRLADQVLSRVHHLVITCDPSGALARAHAGGVGSVVLTMPERANDQGFAMTSSFTSMLLTVLLAFGGDAPATVEALARAAESVLDAHDRIDALSSLHPQRVIALGSGPHSGLAREAALKLLELTAGSIDTYFDSALGFRHGPKAVMEANALTVVFVSNDPYTNRYDEDIARELRDGGGRVLTVRATGDAGSVDQDDWLLPGLRGLPDAFVALPYAVIAQLLALHASVANGVATDDPFPGGAVNRVVRGVTIHPLAE